MDPYLEHPVLWEGFHTCLIVEIMKQLQPQLEPRYVAAVEQRIFLGRLQQTRKPDVRIEKSGASRRSAKPIALVKPRSREVLMVEVDVDEIKQRRIEIKDLRTGMKLVTAIEVVSPTNKVGGEGRRSYRRKQAEFLNSECHLVEIDLLRKGKHVVAVPEWRIQLLDDDYDYVTSVSRWPNRSRFETYLGQLRKPLAKVSIPLQAPDRDVLLNLKDAIDQVWYDSRYFRMIPYDKDCIPPLPSGDQKWATGRWIEWRRSNANVFKDES